MMFMKCTHKKLIKTLPNYKKNPDFPSLANEIAESHQDINIKVAAFTVSEKSSNTCTSLDKKYDNSYIKNKHKRFSYHMHI